MKRMAPALLVLTVCLVFVACGPTDRKPSGPPENVTIAYATPPYTVLADIALARGYFRQEGLNVTPHFHPSGKAALDEVLTGKAEFATVAETPVMLAIMNGHKIAIIATIQASNRTNVILARKDKGILSPRDLKGKRIGVLPGSVGDYFLDAFLSANGLSRKRVTIVDVRLEAMPDALSKGEIDAASTWSPFLNRAQEMLGEKAVTFYEEDIFTQTMNLVATEEQVRANPGRVRKVLLALIEAEKFAAHNPAEAQHAVADLRQFDRAVLGGLWASHTFAVSLDQSLLLALEDESQWAIRNKLTRLTRVPNYLDFIHLEGLQAVKPKAVRIVR